MESEWAPYAYAAMAETGPRVAKEGTVGEVEYVRAQLVLTITILSGSPEYAERSGARDAESSSGVDAEWLSR
jgi:hypothetical protein